MDYHFSPYFGLFLNLCFVNLINCQFPVIGDHPYFRGLISALPYTNSNGEFLPSSEDPEKPVVHITSGALQGITMRTVNGRKISAFQSVPFAEPPLGNLRFKDPIKKKSWKGVLSAQHQSPECLQLDMVRGMQIHGTEDCLYLNVYVPQEIFNLKNQSLPVLIFFHPGSFFFGSGSFYGPRYLLDRNVILVTVNYRLGPFGFLSTGDIASPGNQGMKDQVMALKWIQENIANFGGDPNSVTLTGSSAGGVSVGFHILSPLSRGLFHRAIAQSGSPFCYWALVQNAKERSKQVAEIFKCPTNSSEEIVQCLQKVPGNLLAGVRLRFKKWLMFPLALFGPTIEPKHPGAFLTKTPEEYYKAGEAADVTLVNGLNRNEMVWFISLLIVSTWHVREINSDWDRIGPIMLEMGYNSTEVNVERARKVWGFYMGNRKLSWETRLNFADLYGDRYVMECSLEFMRYHSKYTKRDVYGYDFTYRGRFGNVQQFGSKPEDWGVSHFDELMYLMNNPDYYQTLKRGDPELEMSQLMTSIWTNFAKFDKPYISAGNTTQDIWQPIEKAKDMLSPLKFLELNLRPKMIEDYYADRYKFWRQEVDPNP